MKKLSLISLFIFIAVITSCKKDSSVNNTSSNELKPSEGQLVVDVKGKKYIYEGVPFINTSNYVAYGGIVMGEYAINGLDTRNPNLAHRFILGFFSNTNPKCEAFWWDLTNANDEIDSVVVKFTVSNGYLTGSGNGSIIKVAFNKVKII